MRTRWVSILVAVMLTVPGIAPLRAAPVASARAVTQSTIKDFAGHFKKTFADAFAPLIERTRDLSPSSGGRTRLVDLSLKTTGGTVKAEGLGLIYPKPSRFEVSLLFRGIREPGASSPLKLNGIVQVNYITYARSKANGLFRGNFNLGGTYRGSIDVNGEITAGRVTSLVVTKGNDSYRVGSAPSRFLSYTSTLAGSETSGSANGTGGNARFDDPEGVAVADDGTVYVADTGNGMIRKVTTKGKVTTRVDELDEPRDVGVDSNGDLIATVGDNKAPLLRIPKGSSEPVPIVFQPEERPSPFEYCYDLVNGSCDGRSPMGTMESAQGIDVQGGVIYVTQSFHPGSIRLVMPDGMVMTAHDSGAGGRDGGDCGHAGILGGNKDVAKGNDGTIYYIISATDCYGVLALRPDGTVGTVAGKLDEFGNTDGIGSARFFNLSGIEFDGSRYIYTAETGNNLIRRVDVRTGEVIRVAGCIPHEPGFPDCSGSSLTNGPSKKAEFDSPERIDIDEWGDIYVADSSNNAVRVVHIVSDPERDPAIQRFAPFSVERGTTSVIEVTGVNLGLTTSANLGPGTSVEVTRAGSRTLFLTLTVAPDAAPGPRSLSITTPYGTASSPPGLGLEILEQGFSGATVETIAGTGTWAPGIHDGPAELSEIGFPAGMTTVGEHRLLVADPLEQRVRLIATKQGATDELVDLLLYASGASNALGSIFASMGVLGTGLQALGVGALIQDAAEDAIRPVVRQAVDEMCAAADSECKWISMPWAGLPMQRGSSDGFRLEAKLSFPSDIVNAGGGTFFIADSGNSRIRVVGLNISEADPQPAPFIMSSAHRLDDRPFAVGEFDDNAALAGITPSSSISKVLMQNGGTALDYAGVEGPRCVSAPDDTAPPLGFPTGIDSTESFVYVADPFCQTIWIFDKESGEATDIQGDQREGRAGLGKCSDGPMSFATFGAPVDVSVDKDGHIWFADAVCNSVRVIQNLDMTEEELKEKLAGYYDNVGQHLPDVASDYIEGAIESADLSFLATNKLWVFTVAGSHHGEAGFVDGAAPDSRFATPTAVSTMTRNGKTVVFVSDAGNHRIRMISLP